jgi:hypothetical protein
MFILGAPPPRTGYPLQVLICSFLTAVGFPLLSLTQNGQREVSFQKKKELVKIRKITSSVPPVESWQTKISAFQNSHSTIL